MSEIDLVARNVRRLRLLRRVSVTELGRSSGLSKQTIATLEAGEGNPTVGTLELIARSLRVSVRTLLTEFGSETRLETEAEANWVDAASVRIRELEHLYGFGYVTTSVLHLIHDAPAFMPELQDHGSLRHVYVLSGRARLGLISSPIDVARNDFVTFPADAPHFFSALTLDTAVHLLTTAPQLGRSKEGAAI